MRIIFYIFCFVICIYCFYFNGFVIQNHYYENLPLGNTRKITIKKVEIDSDLIATVVFVDSLIKKSN